MVSPLQTDLLPPIYTDGFGCTSMYSESVAIQEKRVDEILYHAEVSGVMVGSTLLADAMPAVGVHWYEANGLPEPLICTEPPLHIAVSGVMRLTVSNTIFTCCVSEPEQPLIVSVSIYVPLVVTVYVCAFVIPGMPVAGFSHDH